MNNAVADGQTGRRPQSLAPEPSTPPFPRRTGGELPVADVEQNVVGCGHTRPFPCRRLHPARASVLPGELKAATSRLFRRAGRHCRASALPIEATVQARVSPKPGPRARRLGVGWSTASRIPCVQAKSLDSAGDSAISESLLAREVLICITSDNRSGLLRKLEPSGGLEPPTPSLPWRCSTN